jgi:tRNA(Arg) A34 adenosine deaminase TadA
MTTEVTDADLPHLRRCVELATEAVEAGDFPFGSVLVAADGTVLAEDRNRELTEGDPTRHPARRAQAEVDQRGHGGPAEIRPDAAGSLPSAAPAR